MLCRVLVLLLLAAGSADARTFAARGAGRAVASKAGKSQPSTTARSRNVLLLDSMIIDLDSNVDAKKAPSERSTAEEKQKVAEEVADMYELLNLMG